MALTVATYSYNTKVFRLFLCIWRLRYDLLVWFVAFVFQFLSYVTFKCVHELLKFVLYSLLLFRTDKT
jgi:hypothetical protein